MPAQRSSLPPSFKNKPGSRASWGSGLRRDIRAKGALQGPGRSLLDDGDQRPSKRLTDVIKEREKSGPGWLGTAFLISMLSQHDLSAADKEWIERKLSGLEAEGDSGEDGLLLPIVQTVAFRFVGLEHQPAVGKTNVIDVSAADRTGRAVKVQCDRPAFGEVDHREAFARISISPTAAGAAVITCHAAGVTERRAIRISI